MWVKHKTSGSQPTLRFDLLASCLFHAICGGSEDCRFFVLRRREWCCLPIVCLYFGSVAVYQTRSGAIRGSVAAREMRERTNKVQIVGKLVPKVQTVPWSNPRYAFATADYKPARMPAPKAEPARLTAAWKTAWHNASDVLQTIVPPGQYQPCTTRPKQSSTDAYVRDRAPRWVHNKHRPIGIPMYKRSDGADMVPASGANRAVSGWKSRWRPPFSRPNVMVQYRQRCAVSFAMRVIMICFCVNTVLCVVDVSVCTGRYLHKESQHHTVKKESRHAPLI